MPAQMFKKALNLQKNSEPNYNIQATLIAKALHCTDSATLDTIRRKLDIAYRI